MYLIPGDSPMGLRAAADSIPWVKESEYRAFSSKTPWRSPGIARPCGVVQASSSMPPTPPEHWPPQELVEQTLELGPARARPRKTDSRPRFAPGPRPIGILDSSHGVCAEVRGGLLRVFMPPQKKLEDLSCARRGSGRHGGEAWKSQSSSKATLRHSMRAAHHRRDDRRQRQSPSVAGADPRRSSVQMTPENLTTPESRRATGSAGHVNLRSKKRRRRVGQRRATRQSTKKHA